MKKETSKKEVKTEYFIQLGMKENGKIVKNQQYSLSEFDDKLCSLGTKGKIITIFNYTFWHRIFHWNAIKKDIKKNCNDVFSVALESVSFFVKAMIDRDTRGKKKTVKAKK